MEGSLGPNRGAVTGRRSLRVNRGARVSLAGYFNTFPAAYWAAHTRVRAMELRAQFEGSGTVALVAIDGKGRPRRIWETALEGSSEVSHEFELAPFREGGSCWLELTADDEFELLNASFSVLPEGDTVVGMATIGIATFNRPEDCIRQIRALGSPELSGILDRVFVIDQGTDRVDAHPGWDVSRAPLGDRLVLVRQRNLGGSGGFARAMTETLRAPSARYMILLDDDALAEPEALLRAVRFADYVSGPAVVGAGMLDFDVPTELYAQSERWNRRTGWVRLRRRGAYSWDFADRSLRSNPLLRRVVRSDFNGWWMCLIPLDVLRKVGLALPLFLKGDDIEYGLRAVEAGIQVVSLPGVAVWHRGWSGKAPTQTWEAYFLHRNRIITNLLHSPYRRGGLMPLHAMLGETKAFLKGEGIQLRLRTQAVTDALKGPELLEGWLPTRRESIQELRTQLEGSLSARIETSGAVRARTTLGLKALRGSLLAHLRLWRAWPRLAHLYRADLDRLSSPTNWDRVFVDG